MRMLTFDDLIRERASGKLGDQKIQWLLWGCFKKIEEVETQYLAI